MLGSKPVSGRQITCNFCLIARYAPSTKDGAKGGRQGHRSSGLFLLFPDAPEELAETREVALQRDAHALGGERRRREVTVGRFAVSAEADPTVRREDVADIEVAHKVRGVCGAVAVTEVAVDEQAVAQEAALQLSVHLKVVPPHGARREVGAEAPVGTAAERGGDDAVELSSERGGEQRTHGCRALSARGAFGFSGAGGVEAAYAEEADGLAVHVLVRGDELAHHAFLIVRNALQVDVEAHLRSIGLSANVEDAVHTRRALSETGGIVEVAQGYAAKTVDRFEREVGLGRITGEGDGAALLQSHTLAYQVLNRHIIGATLEGIGAVHFEVALVVISGTQRA